ILLTVGPLALPACERSVVSRSANGTALMSIWTLGGVLRYSATSACSALTVSGAQWVRNEILTVPSPPPASSPLPDDPHAASAVAVTKAVATAPRRLRDGVLTAVLLR